MPVNAATKFAIRAVLREAINKSNEGYRGNVNRRNCRHASQAAAERLDREGNPSLVAEHAIPVSIALREFESLHDPSPEQVADLLASFATMVLVTPEEDARLRAAGLVKSMPPEWDRNDIFARYAAAGILVKPYAPAGEAMDYRAGPGPRDSGYHCDARDAAR